MRPFQLSPQRSLNLAKKASDPYLSNLINVSHFKVQLRQFLVALIKSKLIIISLLFFYDIVDTNQTFQRCLRVANSVLQGATKMWQRSYQNELHDDDGSLAGQFCVATSQIKRMSINYVTFSINNITRGQKTLVGSAQLFWQMKQ